MDCGDSETSCRDLLHARLDEECEDDGVDQNDDGHNPGPTGAGNPARISIPMVRCLAKCRWYVGSLVTSPLLQGSKACCEAVRVFSIYALIYLKVRAGGLHVSCYRG